MPIHAVLFDLDGTLWRVEAPPDFDAVTRLQAAELAPHFARLGLDHLNAKEFVRRFWTKFQSWVSFDPAGPGFEEPRWLQGPTSMRRAFAGYGVECSHGDAECLWKAMNSVHVRHFNLRLFRMQFRQSRR